MATRQQIFLVLREGDRLSEITVTVDSEDAALPFAKDLAGTIFASPKVIQEGKHPNVEVAHVRMSPVRPIGEMLDGLDDSDQADATAGYPTFTRRQVTGFLDSADKGVGEVLITVDTVNLPDELSATLAKACCGEFNLMAACFPQYRVTGFHQSAAKTLPRPVQTSNPEES